MPLRTWTPQSIEKIPEVYRDFMLTLKPVIDSRQQIMKITGMPLGRITSYLRMKYPYEVEQIRQIKSNLEKEGMIQEDAHGFIVPTWEGEKLIEAIAGIESSSRPSVPEWPQL